MRIIKILSSFFVKLNLVTATKTSLLSPAQSTTRIKNPVCFHSNFNAFFAESLRCFSGLAQNAAPRKSTFNSYFLHACLDAPERPAPPIVEGIINMEESRELHSMLESMPDADNRMAVCSSPNLFVHFEKHR